MLIITLILICVFAYGGWKVYHLQTRESGYFDSNSFPPALGGWLIWLLIVLFVTIVTILMNLVKDDYFSTKKWDWVTVGVNGVMYKSLLVYEVIGYVSLICFSVFCLVLVFKKRDIAPRFLKAYYLTMVGYLFLDYFFNSLVEREFSNYGMEQIIKAVIIAALWTYYLNVSNRVKQTFVVPYPN
jgi:hypothetical protein